MRTRTALIAALAVVASTFGFIGAAGAAGPDTDVDGIEDALDNCLAVANPAQGDADGDGIGNVCDDPVTTVAPTTDLVNGNPVAVSGAGRGNALFVVQCTIDMPAVVTGPEANGYCGANFVNPLLIDGAFSTSISVRRSQLTIDGSRTLLCGAAPGDCIIAVAFFQPDGSIQGTRTSISFETVVVPVDGDGDGVNDEADNCPATPNGDQADGDSDGVGDACDPDVEGDGVPDASDNCPDTSNAAQGDADGDGIGNVCDDPTTTVTPTTGLGDGQAVAVSGTGRGIFVYVVLCPTSLAPDASLDDAIAVCGANFQQISLNDGAFSTSINVPLSQLTISQTSTLTCGAAPGDCMVLVAFNEPTGATRTPISFGAAPPVDSDGDGVTDDDDNCPAVVNATQADGDHDGIGTVCDPTSFGGFLQPVDNTPVVNVGKAGRTYPVKFQLRDPSGAFVSSLAAVTSVRYKAVPCDGFTGDPSDALETVATGDTDLRYDAGGNQFVYNWKTPSAVGCYELFVTLADGGSHVASFHLNK